MRRRKLSTRENIDWEMEEVICNCIHSSQDYADEERRFKESLPEEMGSRESARLWDDFYKGLKEKYQTPCMFLGVEPFYSAPYCEECLRELLEILCKTKDSEQREFSSDAT